MHSTVDRIYSDPDIMLKAQSKRSSRLSGKLRIVLMDKSSMQARLAAAEERIRKASDLIVMAEGRIRKLPAGSHERQKAEGILKSLRELKATMEKDGELAREGLRKRLSFEERCETGFD